MKNITLIKLGGSVITNKEVPMMVRQEALTRLVREISRAKSLSGEQLIVGHGQGSFAHAPAMQYQTIDGFVNEHSQFGMAVVHDCAMQLNRIVVREFLSENQAAISYMMSNNLLTDNRAAVSWSSDTLIEYLRRGLIPITGGDVIADKSQGCTVWSTEKVLGHIATELPKQSEHQVGKIVHVTEVDGVLDSQGRVITEISEENLQQVKESISATKGFDVTGGMLHKIEESLLQAKNGIETMIISGLQVNNLYNCLIGAEFVGTRVLEKSVTSRSNVFQATPQLVG